MNEEILKNFYNIKNSKISVEKLIWDVNFKTKNKFDIVILSDRYFH